MTLLNGIRALSPKSTRDFPLSFASSVSWNARHHSTDSDHQDAPKQIRILRSSVHDPFFNMAVEDWLFRQSHKIDIPTLYLWRNENVVFIGRNQNPWKECDLHTMENDKVHLVRRFSGGGAVYQDLGNTCWTFLQKTKDGQREENTKLVVEALSSLNIPSVTASGRNDVSGAAFKYSGNRMIHHGTCLINVDLDRLTKYLNPNKEKLRSKGLASVRARVMNLSEIDKQISHEKFCDSLIKLFRNKYNVAAEVEDLEHETMNKNKDLIAVVDQLKDWNWRFGETPQFDHNIETRFDWGIIDMHINSSRSSVITNVKIYSDSLYVELIDELTNALTGIKYSKEGIKESLLKLHQKAEAQGLSWAPYVLDVMNWLMVSI